jgi:hypothetical protein
VKSTRARQTAALVVLTLAATAAVLALPDRTLPRAIAGIALALLLPWTAAARLDVTRLIDRPGGRFAAAGGIALASLVLLGLVLGLTNIGLTQDSAAIGSALIVLALTLAGHRAARVELQRPRLSAVGLTLLALAAAIVVVAFALARGGALESGRRGSGYAAFVVADTGNLRVGLRNATELPARFTVRVLGSGRSEKRTITVQRNQLRLLPTPARPAAEDLKIRVTVRVDGQRKGPVMTLSSSALS